MPAPPIDVVAAVFDGDRVVAAERVDRVVAGGVDQGIVVFGPVDVRHLACPSIKKARAGQREPYDCPLPINALGVWH